MLKRTITAVIAIGLLIPFLIWSDTAAFLVLATLLSVIGVGEMLLCIGCLRRWYVSVPAFAVSIALPLLTRLGTASAQAGGYARRVLPILVLYLLLLWIGAVFSKGKAGADDTPAADGAMAFSTVTYIALGFSALVLLRDYGTAGKYVYLLAIIAPWVTDTAAYFCGRAFGEHSLIPEVSPKKTVEGAVGGVIFCTAFVILYAVVLGNVTDAWWKMIPVGIALSVLSQCGDLTASLIKRQFGIKDYGKLFPGHGGVMDRFDSVLMSALCLWLFTECSFLRLFL